MWPVLMILAACAIFALYTAIICFCANRMHWRRVEYEKLHPPKPKPKGHH